MNHQLVSAWVALAVFLGASPVAVAKAKKRRAKLLPVAAESQEAEDDDDETERHGPWSVPVPQNLRHKGYALRIDGHVTPLDASEVSLRGADWRQRVELLDRGGRVLSDEWIYVDRNVFDSLSERLWRLNAWVGSAEINGQSFGRLQQSGELSEEDLDLDWQPGAFGLRLGYARQSGTNAGSVDSIYDGVQWRLMGTYAAAPLAATSGALRRLETLVFAGLFTAHNELRLTDGYVSLGSACDTIGPLAGVDLRLPVSSALAFMLRGYASYQHVRFKEFGYQQEFVERGALLGGSYAF